MSRLLTKLRATKKFNHEDLRRYVALLDGDDPNKLDELKDFAHSMNKTMENVEEDANAIRDAKQHALRISAGRDTSRALEEINLRIAQHDGDTRRIVKDRQAEAQPLHDQRGELIAARDEALKSIGALNDLKTQFPDLLESFMVLPESELH